MEIPFIFLNYIDDELTRKLSTHDATYLVFQSYVLFLFLYRQARNRVICRIVSLA